MIAWTEYALVERGYEDQASWVFDGVGLLGELERDRRAGLDSYIIERLVVAHEPRPSSLGTP